MAKKKYYNVHASKENQMDDIIFHKDDDGLICIHLGYDETRFTVKECREIIEKLKKCILD